MGFRCGTIARYVTAGRIIPTYRGIVSIAEIEKYARSRRKGGRPKGSKNRPK